MAASKARKPSKKSKSDVKRKIKKGPLGGKYCLRRSKQTGKMYKVYK